MQQVEGLFQFLPNLPSRHLLTVDHCNRRNGVSSCCCSSTKRPCRGLNAFRTVNCAIANRLPLSLLLHGPTAPHGAREVVLTNAQCNRYQASCGGGVGHWPRRQATATIAPAPLDPRSTTGQVALHMRNRCWEREPKSSRGTPHAVIGLPPSFHAPNAWPSTMTTCTQLHNKCHQESFALDANDEVVSHPTAVGDPPTIPYCGHMVCEPKRGLDSRTLVMMHGMSPISLQTAIGWCALCPFLPP